MTFLFLDAIVYAFSEAAFGETLAYIDKMDPWSPQSSFIVVRWIIEQWNFLFLAVLSPSWLKSLILALLRSSGPLLYAVLYVWGLCIKYVVLDIPLAFRISFHEMHYLI